MNRKEWLVWLITVLFIVIASTVPFRIYWKTSYGPMASYGTIFEHIKHLIEYFIVTRL